MGKVVVKQLSKTFEAGGNPAVDRVDLTVADGQIVSMLGPSGCGKTTTLRCIAGLERPDSGEIWLDDRQLTIGSRHLIPPQRREMGMVFQSYSIWPHMTVRENLAIGLRAKKLKRAEIERKVTEVLTLVRLPGFADRPATDLSGGQQQRVAVARSLALEPKVLLFDEPLSNLDSKLRDEMRLELGELLRKLRISAIYVTHDQAEAFVLSDRIYVMNEGRIVQCGTPAEIYREPATHFVAEFIGAANLLSGTVIGLDGAQVTVGLADSQVLQTTGSAQIGEHVDVCIRSEAIELMPCASGPLPEHVLLGQIARRIYLGSTYEYLVSFGSEQVRVSAPNSLRLEPGQSVWARMAPENALALQSRTPGDGGREERSAGGVYGAAS
jgi:iron(III) transport system ATP-binding protein